MSLYRNTTQIPNELFDLHLKTLSGASLKVFLFIIRRTIGQVGPLDSKRRVERAWISQSLFTRACGISGRSVSSAIEYLVKHSLIQVTSHSGSPLGTKEKRQGASRLYFASRLRLEASKSSEVSYQNPVTNLHTIKLNRMKLSCYNSSQGVKRISDVQRYEQIIQNLPNKI